MQLFGVIVFILGICLLPFLPIGTLIGIVLIIMAFGLGYKKKAVWKCKECGYFFERA